jgi:regulator of RNase E activity RraA
VTRDRGVPQIGNDRFTDRLLFVPTTLQQNVVTEAKRAQREEAFIAPAEKAGQTIEERKKAKKSKKREE